MCACPWVGVGGPGPAPEDLPERILDNRSGLVVVVLGKYGGKLVCINSFINIPSTTTWDKFVFVFGTIGGFWKEPLGDRMVLKRTLQAAGFILGRNIGLVGRGILQDSSSQNFSTQLSVNIGMLYLQTCCLQTGQVLLLINHSGLNTDGRTDVHRVWVLWVNPTQACPNKWNRPFWIPQTLSTVGLHPPGPPHAAGKWLCRQHQSLPHPLQPGTFHSTSK